MLSQSTVTGNRATLGQGGGIFSFSSPVTITNSIVAGNTDNGTAPNIFKSTTDALSVSHSLIGDNTGIAIQIPATVGTTPDANGNFIGGTGASAINAHLGPLANHGGPTLTHALLAGSLAIDSGSNALAVDVTQVDTPALTTDQRGVGFPRIVNSTVNMGASEATPSALQAIVPLYQYPLSAPNTLSNWWQRVLVSATIDQPVTVIINPSNGPLDPAAGGADYANYLTGLTLLRANPYVRILGYVATGYGATSQATILQQAGWYAAGYKHTTTGASLVDGIFLDEMSTNVAHVAAYTAVATGIRAINGLAANMIAGNPGVAVPLEYLDGATADLFIIREGTLADLLTNPTPSYVTSPAYDHLSFGAIVHSTTSSVNVADALREFKLRGIDYGFVTDDALPNPFDQAPPYFETFLRDIHAPYIRPTTLNLAENTISGTVVLNETGGDPDQGQTLTYAITAGNTGGAFAINPTTGQITVANQLALNFEVNPVFTLTIQVTDNGVPNLSDVGTVTVNLTNVAEGPVFTGSTSFSFEEFSPRWTLIGKLNATDPEWNALMYSIVGGNPDNTLFISDGSVVADGGKLWVFHQDLTGLRHRGMFNLRVRVTDNSSQALFTETDVQVFITPSPNGTTRVNSGVDGAVLDGDGNGFSGSDTLNTNGTGMLVQGGANPSRGLLEFNLASLPTNRTLKSAWLFFGASALVGGATVNVPIDVFGYAGDGVLAATDATLGTKIGSRPISNAGGSNQLKIHAAQLDANFVRGLIGSGQLGLVLRNGGTSDGVVIHTSESNVASDLKPYLVLQFGDLPPDIIVRDVGATGTGQQFLTLNSNGTTFNVNTADVFAASSWERFLTGDFNGDGRTDIVGRHSTTG